MPYRPNDVSENNTTWTLEFVKWNQTTEIVITPIFDILDSVLNLSLSIFLNASWRIDKLIKQMIELNDDRKYLTWWQLWYVTIDLVEKHWRVVHSTIALI